MKTGGKEKWKRENIEKDGENKEKREKKEKREIIGLSRKLSPFNP